MNHSFHYLMMITNSVFQKKILDQAGKEGLMPGQPKILDFLKDHNDCEQKEIAQGCHLEPATVTGLLNRMAQAGLIERQQLHGNRRSFYIKLTPEGEAMQKTTEEIFRIHEETAFQHFSEEEQETFMHMLERIYQNLTGEVQ